MISTLNKRPKVGNESGFTLVEIAIVIFIMASVFALGAQFFKIYMGQKKYNITFENMDMAQQGLYEFYALNGRYPCPANPALPPNHPSYAVEQCRNNALPGCVVAGVACVTEEAGDPEGDGAPDFVMIGALPFRTMTLGTGGAVPISVTPFRAVHGVDGFGMHFTYAVSERMANRTTNSVLRPANARLGAILVVDENSILLTEPPASAQYVLVSHGENRDGAYTKTGTRVSGCLVTSLGGIPAPPGPIPAADEREKENCDYNDARFVKAGLSFQNGSNYFDDIVYFKPSGRDQLWIKVISGVAGEANIENTNLGNVGVGLNNPAERLHVAGDISAQKGMFAASYCDQSRNECFNPAHIAGTGYTCPNGQIARGLHDPANNDVVRLECASVFTTLPSTSCAIGEVMTGMRYVWDNVASAGTTEPICAPSP